MDWTSTTGVALLSSIVGATAALFGVLLTSGFNVFIQWRQRQHDSRQKAMDRLGVLRRDVYLEAVTLCVNAMHQLPQLTQRSGQAERTQALTGVSLAMAKLQIVCSPETASMAQAYNAAFATVVPKLLLAAQNALKIEIDIDNQNELKEFKKRLDDQGFSIGCPSVAWNLCRGVRHVVEQALRFAAGGRNAR